MIKQCCDPIRKLSHNKELLQDECPCCNLSFSLPDHAQVPIHVHHHDGRCYKVAIVENFETGEVVIDVIYVKGWQ